MHRSIVQTKQTMGIQIALAATGALAIDNGV